jgi:hypothetical protein
MLMHPAPALGMPRTFLASSLSLLTLVAAGSALAAGPAELTDTTRDSGRPMAPEQAAVVFEHADLSFKLIPADKRLEGDATLRLRATSPLSALVVDLDRNYAVGRVEVDGRAIAPGDWSNPEGRMRIALPRPLAAGKAVTLRIVYAGSPHEAKKAPWDGGIVWATAPTGEPWVATAVEGEGCDLLWPCIDHPKGEPAQVDEHITVPAPLVAPGNGVLVGMREHAGWRTYHWRARQPDTYAVTLNAGPFEQLQADYRSRYGNVIPLAFWYLKGHREKAEKLFAEFPKMLDFFEGVIGPYPFGDEKMGVVETPHLGMEHQTINAYGNGYKRDKYGYDWLLQHEFSHEWFGNQLTNADWDDMWLHEGFGSYMQPLYLQYLRGQMDYHAALLDRAGVANKVPMVSGHTMTEEGVYNADNGPGNDIYYKGSYMLHMLRGLIGDEAFFRSIRELVYGTDAPRPGNFRPRYAGAGLRGHRRARHRQGLRLVLRRVPAPCRVAATAGRTRRDRPGAALAGAGRRRVPGAGGRAHRRQCRPHGDGADARRPRPCRSARRCAVHAGPGFEAAARGAAFRRGARGCGTAAQGGRSCREENCARRRRLSPPGRRACLGTGGRRRLPPSSPSRRAIGPAS